MASNKDLEIKVAVEAMVHRAVRTVLQEVERDYGLRVNSIHVEWVDISNMEKSSALISSLGMHTTSVQS
jgi:hypothetical protein